MDPAPANFESNKYYRLVNVGLGLSQCLDVANPPDGSLTLGPTGAQQGQIWQLLEAASLEGYYMSSHFLGAKMKLDVLPNERGQFSPWLREYTTNYEQTWTFSPYVDAMNNLNETSWTISPNFIGGRAPLVFSVRDDATAPVLVPYVDGDAYQRWFVVTEGMPINDPTYSANHLPALATEAPMIAVAEPTVAPLNQVAATASSNPAAATPQPAAPSSKPATPPSKPAAPTSVASVAHPDDKDPRVPLFVAAVVPTTVFVLVFAAIVLWICMRRRKLRKMDENVPYMNPGPASSVLTGDGRRAAAPSTKGVVCEIFDRTFVDSPLDQWKREKLAKRRSTTPSQAMTNLSLASSNLSASSWSLRDPQASQLDIANALTAPPTTRSKSRKSKTTRFSEARSVPLTVVGQSKRAMAVSFVDGKALRSPVDPSKTPEWAESAGSNGTRRTSSRAGGRSLLDKSTSRMPQHDEEGDWV